MLAGATLRVLALSAASADDIKAPLRGLVSMGAYRFVGSGGDPVNTLEPLDAKPGIFGGLVVIASWKQLQPTPDSRIGDDNVINQALAMVRDYNTRNPAKPLGVKLRVWGGFEAPDWAKQIGGAPVDTVHRKQQLAARFDKQPLIREVSVTSCMSFTAEPFFVPIEDTVMPLLRDGGFTDQAYKDCLTHALGDYAPWKQSRLVLSVNPLRTAPGQGPGDPAFTEGVMRNCRQVAPLRVRQPRSRHRPRAAALSHLCLHEAVGPRDRISDRSHDAEGFRRHDYDGRVLRRELDRALSGLRRLSAGAGRQAQTVGGADRNGGAGAMTRCEFRSRDLAQTERGP
jgi:hypothetical protein